MAELRSVLGTGGPLTKPVRHFLDMTPAERQALFDKAPLPCHGGSIIDTSALERCTEAICSNRNAARPRNLWEQRPNLLAIALTHRATLNVLSTANITALRHHLAQSLADQVCKDPPNDGNRAVVTDRPPVPVPEPVPLGVALVALAAIAAVRLASMVRPELRTSGPGLIEGIYIWMGLTPPEGFIAPPTIDGHPLHNSYSGT